MKEFNGYLFKDASLLEAALTHSSYVNENKLSFDRCYERLEFLGDAVLDTLISEKLFYKFKKLPEGELTRLRAALVCEASLAKKARELSLDSRIRLSKGERLTGGKDKNSILCDIFEALIGAVFVDGGFEAARACIMPLFEQDIELLMDAGETIDAKSHLQEELQKTSREQVVYNLVSSEGPDHNKTFAIDAVYAGEIIGSGLGRSKKEAEQNAAANALSKLGL